MAPLNWGPITGMSEAIVDLVSTGKTLQQNGLTEIEVLFESTAYLIAHPFKLSFKYGRTERFNYSNPSTING